MSNKYNDKKAKMFCFNTFSSLNIKEINPINPYEKIDFEFERKGNKYLLELKTIQNDTDYKKLIIEKMKCDYFNESKYNRLYFYFLRERDGKFVESYLFKVDRKDLDKINWYVGMFWEDSRKLKKVKKEVCYAYKYFKMIKKEL